MSGAPWEDRRGLFQRGKEVHEPGRKLSGSGSSITEALRRASTSSTTGSPMADKPAGSSDEPGSPAARRRRSSTASNSALFANLQQHKRGSEDYATRRASQTDQLAAGGTISGWFNSTFRGVQQKPVAETKPDSSKRGVME